MTCARKCPIFLSTPPKNTTGGKLGVTGYGLGVTGYGLRVTGYGLGTKPLMPRVTTLNSIEKKRKKEKLTNWKICGEKYDAEHAG